LSSFEANGSSIADPGNGKVPGLAKTGCPDADESEDEGCDCDCDCDALEPYRGLDTEGMLMPLPLP
jgi:hypothetical protein